MERYKQTRFEVDYSKMTKTEMTELLQEQAKGNLEIVKDFESKEEKLKGWSTNPDHVLKMAKAKHFKVTARFPEVYTEEGEKVTEENLDKVDLEKIISKKEYDARVAEANEEAEKAQLVKDLNKLTKAELEKKYGVSSDQLKEDMIMEIIDDIYSEGEA